MLSEQDFIWKAMADPTRRAVLDLLRMEPLTTGALVEEFPRLSRFAVMKHLGILERAGLIVVKRKGRFRWNYLNGAPLQEVYERWVTHHQGAIASKLFALKHHTEQKQNTMETLSHHTVVVEVSIEASIERTWEALTKEIGSWWRKDFYTSANTKTFVLEPRLGGMMYEDAENGEGLVWGRVFGLRSPHYLEIQGLLTPAWGGPALTMMKIELESIAEGTKVTISDTQMGKVSEKQNASLESGWKLLFGEGLKPYVEGQ